MRFHNDPEGTRLPIKLDTATNKVFGLNALKVYSVPYDVVRRHVKDRVAIERDEQRERPDPTFLTYGPRTRREFLNLKAWGG